MEVDALPSINFQRVQPRMTSFKSYLCGSCHAPCHCC